METIDRELAAWLVHAGLVEDDGAMRAEPLTGGVASDIWLVQAGGRRFAVKRALAKLKVARDWRAPVSRNGNEVEWLLEAGRIVPDAVPRVLAHDARVGAFAMDFLRPEDHPVWKNELKAGRADPAFAASVGRAIAAIHGATAHSATRAARFDTDAIFHSIRLEPYLEATAEAHPDLADQLMALSRDTLATKIALVHGDVSPKNILVGPKGPVFLDAECAWYGDPAFDLAFCLNHMLLKCLWVPASRAAYLASFDALATAYLDSVGWEPREKIEARAARLLPGLLLARVDGKSPGEYITTDADKDRVRRVARPLIATPPTTLAAIRDAWEEELAK
jgi:aminoglycoside phosphotransferase (APT) family kinase protein